MSEYLKDISYYEDLYDKGTVEWGLWHENYWLNEAKEENGDQLSADMAKSFCEFELYFYKGNRFEHRENKIQEWMERDRQKDNLMENTPLPEAVCFLCNKQMRLVHKDLRTNHKTDVYHVEFIFRCEECNVASTFGKKGRENHVPWQCPDCKRRLKIDNSKKGRKYITKKHCDFCGYDDEDIFELSPITKKTLPTKDEVKKFQEDKLRFCLSIEDGMKYLESQRSMHRLTEMFKEMDGKKDEPKVKVMSIKEAQSALKKILKGAGCENIRFLDPDIGHDVVFQFKAIDAMGREAYDAKKALKKAIKNGFEGTNWSLMTEGIGFRLGVLDGRMRGKDGDSFADKSIIF